MTTNHHNLPISHPESYGHRRYRRACDRWLTLTLLLLWPGVVHELGHTSWLEAILMGYAMLLGPLVVFILCIGFWIDIWPGIRDWLRGY